MNIFKRAVTLEVAIAIKAEKEVLKCEYVAQQADVSFREEVIAELVASGIAPHVAANMTNTEAKLMAKAREIEYI